MNDSDRLAQVEFEASVWKLSQRRPHQTVGSFSEMPSEDREEFIKLLEESYERLCTNL